MPGIQTKNPIVRDITGYDDLLEINKELLRLAALDEADPLMVHALMDDFIKIMDSLASQRLYVMLGKAAKMMDATILEIFKRPDIAEVISELYFQNFQAPVRLVYSISAGPDGQLQCDGYSNESRDSLVSRGMENVIVHDGFRTDADHHLMDKLITDTLKYTGNPQPALDYCEAIMSSVNESGSGIDVIFTALRRLHTSFPVSSSPSPAAAGPLLEWMKVNEDQLVGQMVNSKPQSWMANELADIFHTNELQGLADCWYLRSGYLDFQRLFEIHQRSGLKPEAAYLDQFLAEDAKPSLKQVRDLLKYSLAVENIIPDAGKWKFRQTWVTTSLVDTFSTFRKIGITPRSPEDCEPLMSTLSEHLKSGEAMKPLMTKNIQPYIDISNPFKAKMFSLDLGL